MGNRAFSPKNRGFGALALAPTTGDTKLLLLYMLKTSFLLFLITLQIYRMRMIQNREIIFSARK